MKLLNALFFIAFLPSASFAQTPDRTEPIRKSLQGLVDAGDVSGVVGILGNSKGVLSNVAVGKADLENNIAMTEDHLFRIASMTKPITALGIMILVEEGKLAITDPVEKHLPEFKSQMLIDKNEGGIITLKKPARAVTVKDLLTHTSGLPGGYPAGMADLYTKRNRTLSEATIAISQRPLISEPGSKWSYCNPGIDTLGRIIEVLSGTSYENFLKTRIFDPLGMTNTTFYPTPEQTKKLARLYAKTDGKLVASVNPLINYADGVKHPIPAGGLVSCGKDLSLLYRMMLNKGTLNGKTIIKPETVAEMTKPQIPADMKAGFVPGSTMGLGWLMVKESTGMTERYKPGTFGHGGAFGTQVWIDPTQDLFVVLLFQRTGVNSDGSPMRKAFQEAALPAAQ